MLEKIRTLTKIFQKKKKYAFFPNGSLLKTIYFYTIILSI